MRWSRIAADIAVGASHASWSAGGLAAGYGHLVQPPADLRADRRFAAGSLPGRVGGGAGGADLEHVRCLGRAASHLPGEPPGMSGVDV